MLVTNDDGIDSPGLLALARAVRAHGADLVIAAPAEQSSGASAAITAVRRDGRTVVHRRALPGLPDTPAWAVQAQPGHIVMAAMTGWLDPRPDLVLSGINWGANVGRMVLHSGTVGAALTAGIHGAVGVAVSLDLPLRPIREPIWPSAADLVPMLLELGGRGDPGAVYSVNVPDAPRNAEDAPRAARLAEAGIVRSRVEEVGEQGLRIAEFEVGDEPEEGTDSALLAAGHATITALRGITEDDEAMQGFGPPPGPDPWGGLRTPCGCRRCPAASPPARRGTR